MEGFIRGGHRKEVQRSKPESMPRMDPGAKEPEPQRGPNVRAQTFWLLLGRLPKVTRRKGGTIISHPRSNGYKPKPKKKPLKKEGLFSNSKTKNQVI